MYVVRGRDSWVRTSSPATLRRNGDFVDICFVRNGLSDWIAIPQTDLRVILEKSNHGDEVKTRISFDVPSTMKTAIRQFLRTDHIQELLDELLEEHAIGTVSPTPDEDK